MARPSFPFHGIFSSLSQNEDDGTDASAFLGDVDPPVQQQQQSSQSSSAAVGQVAVDIYELDDYYIIKAPIAGVRLCDLDIEVTDSVVTIRGVRRQTDQIPSDRYYIQECFWGEFSRSVTLPFKVDAKRIKATFNKESILKILVPKEEKVKIIRISEA